METEWFRENSLIFPVFAWFLRKFPDKAVPNDHLLWKYGTKVNDFEQLEKRCQIAV